jgi:5-(carboxyamino)imidazole ribonucleotide mutase
MAEPTRVAIIIGSKSDREHLEATTGLLDRFGISWELEVISAHRQPEKLHAYVASAEGAGVRVFITAAGLSAALPGVVSSLSNKPVIGIPIPGGALKGVDALLSIVQMPGGIPVAAVGVGSNGSKNAAVLAAEILALGDAAVAKALAAYREELREG